MFNAHINYFAPSELIINERGAIYHLNVAPGEIADTIITVGDPARVPEVSKHFDIVEHKLTHREFVTHTGYVGKKRISVVGTGIGPDNIDIVINELDALANINFQTRTEYEQQKYLSIIRLGTCGSLQKDIPVDSLVVSSYALGLDNLMHFYKHNNNPDESYILNEFKSHIGLASNTLQPYIAEGSIALRKHFMKGFTHGMTATCPGFYGPQGRILRGAITYPNLIDALGTFKSREQQIINFEMETSAIYGLGSVFGHHCLSINTVVANRVQKTFSDNAAQAIEHMIKNALEIIETI